MVTQKLNLMTIDKLLSLLKNKTSSWTGLLQFKEEYLLAEISTTIGQGKDGKALTMATITFIAGTPSGQAGIGSRTHIHLSLDDITASLLGYQAGYVIKTVKHLVDLFTKHMESKKQD